jgi:hypothetical protein
MLREGVEWRSDVSFLNNHNLASTAEVILHFTPHIYVDDDTFWGFAFL